MPGFHVTDSQGCGVTQHSLSRSPVIIFTHPLLTALAWHSYTSGLVAPETWRACTEAQRRASHRTTDACAVVPAAGLERLPVAVTHSIQDAAHADHLCTHSYCVPRAVPAIVTIEAPVGVADGSLCAVVPQLLGTYLTAFTAVCD